MAKAKDVVAAAGVDPRLTWDAAILRAAGALVEKGKSRDARWAAACDELMRALPADKIKPGAGVVSLRLAEAPEPGVPEAAKLTGHVWPLDGSQPGYVGVFLGDGSVFVFRVMHFRPQTIAGEAITGGNDYVLIDKWTPGVAI